MTTTTGASLLVSAALLLGCAKTSRRDAIADLRPALSAARADLLALVPTLPEVGKLAAPEVPPDALELDAKDPARDNTIVVGVPTLRDPYNVKADDLLQAGYAYQHRWLGCLRDASDGSQGGALEADPAYRPGCERAAAARYALVYRVASHEPARFELANGALSFEPGQIAVDWFVVDLGPPEARAAKVVGQLTTAARTPETLTISVDKGAEPGLVEARRQAAQALATAITNELQKALVGKARHVAL